MTVTDGENQQRAKRNTCYQKPASEESPVAQFQPNPDMWKGRCLNWNSPLHDEMFYANGYVLDWVH